MPYGAERADRLGSVLEVIYLIFNEGYAATAGDDWLRPALCEDALRLARVLAGLMPKEPEVHGLVALLELQASRTAARTGPDGEPVLLADQNRSRWNQLLIRRGFAALARRERDARRRPGPVRPPGRHRRLPRPGGDATRRRTGRRSPSCTAGSRRSTPSPVVELNRAVAVSMAEGPEAGLAIVDALAAEPALKDYHLLPSVRGDLLARLGRTAEARAEFERAAALTRNERETGAAAGPGLRVRTGRSIGSGTCPPALLPTAPAACGSTLLARPRGAARRPGRRRWRELHRLSIGVSRLLLLWLTAFGLAVGWGLAGAALKTFEESRLDAFERPVRRDLRVHGRRVHDADRDRDRVLVSAGTRPSVNGCTQWSSLDRDPTNDARFRSPGVSLCWFVPSFLLCALGLWLCVRDPGDGGARPGDVRRRHDADGPWR